MNMSPEDAFRQLTTASLVVRDRSPIEVSVPCIEAAFGLLDWGMREAPTTSLREFARSTLARAVLPRPGFNPGVLPAFLVPPEPPRPGAA